MAPRTHGYIRFNNVALITRHARRIGEWHGPPTGPGRFRSSRFRPLADLTREEIPRPNHEHRDRTADRTTQDRSISAPRDAFLSRHRYLKDSHSGPPPPPRVEDPLTLPLSLSLSPSLRSLEFIDASLFPFLPRDNVKRSIRFSLRRISSRSEFQFVRNERLAEEEADPDVAVYRESSTTTLFVARVISASRSFVPASFSPRNHLDESSSLMETNQRSF